MIFHSLPNPHVISLERKLERRRSFFDNAAKAGVSGIEWFQAIDGRDLPDLPKWASSTPGVYGCLHSHTTLYRKALAAGWEALTVFEDDAIIVASMPILLQEINRRAPGTDYFSLYPPLDWCLGAFGYVIFPRLMEEIVSQMDSNPFPQGERAHIDRLIHALCCGRWKRAEARRPLVSHAPRDPTESTVEWACSYMSTKAASGSGPDMERIAENSRLKLLITVCSCHGNNERRAAVRDTWATALPENAIARFFVGTSDGDAPIEPDTVEVAAGDDYNSLPSKVMRTFQFALENIEFDYLFKCDDDTYLAVDRLISRITPGLDFLGNEFLLQQGFASGGAGYLLSRKWVEQLVRCGNVPEHGPEDVLISKALIESGARPHYTDDLCWNSSRFPRLENSVISSHWCTPEKMRAIHVVFTEQPEDHVDVVHPGWSDRILFYPHNIFARTSTQCLGIWEERTDGSLLLRWFDWNPEVLSWQDGEDDQAPCAKAPQGIKRRVDAITVLLRGGLGNQMFQYAHALALARHFDAKLEVAHCDTMREFSLDIFGIVPSGVGNQPDQLVEDESEYQPQRVWPTLATIRASSACRFRVSGYFQNEGFFGPVEDEIRKLFSLALQPGHQGNREATCIHVRRGDFTGNPIHDLCEPGYYAAAMRIISTFRPLTRFVVFSDDPEWCRRCFSGDPRIEVTDLLPVEDTLRWMQSFGSHILSNSTFGWWAAYISGASLVVAPNEFIAGRNWNICPKGWITIPARSNHSQFEGTTDCFSSR